MGGWVRELEDRQNTFGDKSQMSAFMKAPQRIGLKTAESKSDLTPHHKEARKRPTTKKLKANKQTLRQQIKCKGKGKCKQ